MGDQRRNNHSVSRLTAHVVWVTKYRYPVLQGEKKERCRELIIQTCEVHDVKIISGVVSKDHIHIHIEYPPKISISDLIKRLKGRTSRLLQKEYSDLSKRYWGKHFWAIGYGVWSTGNITDKMVKEYLEHHKNQKDIDNSNFIIE